MVIQHVGIIPDGNRRWARKSEKDLHETYVLFFERILSVILVLKNAGIHMQSFYVLSIENLQRNHEDVDAVLSAFENVICDKIMDFTEKHPDLRFRFIGNQAYWPDKIKQKISSIEKACAKDGAPFVVNFLIAYNPFDEINSVVNSKADLPLTVEKLSVPLYLDLIIRTGGEQTRISNFLPLQSGYATIHMVDRFFLDFDLSNYEKILSIYSDIDPRYGK
ncbi:MAG: undecaprenyl diphosphate synthase family protein [Oscillospiraceae bacterium]|nr:undecaprenyl diphosphate synthase family protein [Oscillospiraceae bacterium]